MSDAPAGMDPGGLFVVEGDAAVFVELISADPTAFTIQVEPTPKATIYAVPRIGRRLWIGKEGEGIEEPTPDVADDPDPPPRITVTPIPIPPILYSMRTVPVGDRLSTSWDAVLGASPARRLAGAGQLDLTPLLGAASVIGLQADVLFDRLAGPAIGIRRPDPIPVDPSVASVYGIGIVR